MQDMGGLFCQQNVNLACEVIPYDLPKYSGPSIEEQPSRLPLRGHQNGAAEAFPSPLLLSDFWIGVILKWLQHVYSGLVAPKQPT